MKPSWLRIIVITELTLWGTVAIVASVPGVQPTRGSWVAWGSASIGFLLFGLIMRWLTKDGPR